MARKPLMHNYIYFETLEVGLDQWKYFNRRWGKMLKRRGVEYYHTKKLKDTDGPFDGWSINKKMEIVNRANDIIGRLE